MQSCPNSRIREFYPIAPNEMPSRHLSLGAKGEAPASDPAALCSILQCRRCLLGFQREPGVLVCPGCRLELSLPPLLVDVIQEDSTKTTLGSRFMASGFSAAIYQSLWRPVMFQFSSGFRLPRFEAEASLVLSKMKGAEGPWLDLACGPGALTRRMVESAGERLVVAVDSSLAMLCRARRAAPGAALVRADALMLPFPKDTFGAVVSLAALDLFPNVRAALEESIRVLRPGGLWVASYFVRAERQPASSAWSAVATELGLHSPTQQQLMELSLRAGLTGFEYLEFGRYVLAWATKGAPAAETT